MIKQKKPIGQLLVEEGIISFEHVKIALSVQKRVSLFLGEILQNLNFVTSLEIAHVVAKQSKLPFIDLDNVNISSDALRLIPKEIALDKKILPINIDNGNLSVATSDINDITTTNYLEKITLCKIDYLICDKKRLSNMIELHYYQLDNPIKERIESLLALPIEEVNIIKLLDLTINNAIKHKATDIHMTPDNYVIHIFYRIDGVLKYSFAFNLALHAKIISRVKILSNLDISQHRLPQDGAFSHIFLDQVYDLRVSTLPTSEGENLVFRILSNRASLFGLQHLGMTNENLTKLKSAFLKPFGMILVTGPTGSGKTTTLYSALQEINALSKNIITVEDPIEYRFSFIKQTQINTKTGYDFATAIRHFMRQDPDVMLVGEIRDEKTAQLAVRASITGHLVLSTIHSNSAITTIPRLLDMSIQSDLLATALHTIIAQRLIRKVCIFCAQKSLISGKLLGFKNKTYDVFEANEEGCNHCNYSGYKGRSAVVELLFIDETLKTLISKQASIFKIEEHAKKRGFVSMRMHALSKVIDGITTLDEVNRVVL